MQVTINFASQPYEEIYRFLLRWKLIITAAALLAIVLFSASIVAFFSWHATRVQANELRRQIEEQDRRRTEGEALLSRPENRQIRLRAELLNSTIARKAFSWTEVFTDLEHIMPPHLHVTNIHPEVNANDQLELHLSVSGSSRGDGIELVRHLEQSSHFSQAYINDERTQASQAGPKASEVIQYSITAVYIPGFARTKAAPDKKEPAADSAAGPSLEVFSNPAVGSNSSTVADARKEGNDARH